MGLDCGVFSGPSASMAAATISTSPSRDVLSSAGTAMTLRSKSGASLGHCRAAARPTPSMPGRKKSRGSSEASLARPSTASRGGIGL